MIFAPASPRAVSVEEATILRRVTPAGITAGGVFKDQPVEDVLRIASQVGLTWVQLHGGFGFDAIAELHAAGLQVIWAVPVALDGRYGAVPSDADLLLFDTAAGGQFGGTGARFAWDATKAPSQPFLIAGGIRPYNVARATTAISGSAGIDLSSGVEAAPGIKSHALLRALGAALLPIVRPVDLDAAAASSSSSEASS